MSSNTSPNGANVSAAADLRVTEGQANAKRSDASADGASSSSEDGGRVLDPELWKPHPPTEDCPVCFVPLPLAAHESTYWLCCGKLICNGCKAETMRARKVINAKRAKKKLPPLDLGTCSFCRTIPNVSASEYEKRIRKGDGRAACILAGLYRNGDARKKIPKNEAKSSELLHHAADDLGHSEAMTKLGFIYSYGEHGAAKDETKGRKYLEDAVKMGNVHARYNLGCDENEDEKIDTAIRHWKLAAAAGDEHSMKVLWKCFSKGALEKSDLEETLRAHKKACDTMHSEERERYALWTKAKTDTDVFLTRILRSYYRGEIKAKELNLALKAHKK